MNNDAIDRGIAELWEGNALRYEDIVTKKLLLKILKAMKGSEEKEIDTREDKIQRLLRHAFSCLQGNKCTCSENIQTFLRTDEASLKWAKDKLEHQ